MSEMSKVEEVARALKEKIASYDWVYFRDLGATCLIDGDIDMNDVAKAAIEAMKKPTEAMLAAGSFALEGLTEEDAKRLGEEEHFQSGAWQAEAVLSAMIDAALKE